MVQRYNKTKRLSSLFGFFYPAGFQSNAKSNLTIQCGIVKFKLKIWQKLFAKSQRRTSAHVPKPYPTPTHSAGILYPSSKGLGGFGYYLRSTCV